MYMIYETLIFVSKEPKSACFFFFCYTLDIKIAMDFI